MNRFNLGFYSHINIDQQTYMLAWHENQWGVRRASTFELWGLFSYIKQVLLSFHLPIFILGWTIPLKSRKLTNLFFYGILQYLL